MKRFTPSLFLLIFVISASFAEASDLRAIEEKAAQRHLERFIEVLKSARNVSVNSNITVLPNDHEAEQVRYCSALLTAVKEKGGAGITVPVPAMSTGRNGNEAILDYIKTIAPPLRPCKGDLSEAPERLRKHCLSIEARIRASERDIPPTFLDDPQYPRFYSVYQLNGTDPTVIVLERQFYDRNYEHLKRVHWIRFMENGRYGRRYSNGGMSFHVKETPSGTRKDNREVGVLEFGGQVLFYNIDTTEGIPHGPGYRGFDRTRKWYARFFAPQKSIEEIFSEEVKREAEERSSYPGLTVSWDYFCEISFD